MPAESPWSAEQVLDESFYPETFRRPLGVRRCPLIAGGGRKERATILAGVCWTCALASAVAMQMMMASIEKSLDELKKDLGYLIRQQHLEIEAGIETTLEIVADVYVTAQRRGSLEDDQWDRVAVLELKVRDLHKLTAKNLRGLARALDDESGSAPAKVARLARALHDERTLLWLRAHVHADLALARWEALYLLRQAEQHPEELGLLT